MLQENFKAYALAAIANIRMFLDIFGGWRFGEGANNANE